MEFLVVPSGPLAVAVPKPEPDAESAPRCRLCLAPQAAAGLTRSDLTAFYCAFRPCGLGLDMLDLRQCDYVCQYCWARAAQCLRFIECARRAERTLAGVSSRRHLTGSRHYSYSISPIDKVVICGSEECLDNVHTRVYSHNGSDIKPEFLNCGQFQEEIEIKFDFTNSIKLESNVSESDSERQTKVDTEDNVSKFLATEDSQEKIVNDRQEKVIDRKETVIGDTQDTEIEKEENSKAIDTIEVETNDKDKFKEWGVEFIPYTTEDQKEEIEMKKQTDKYRKSRFKCEKCGAAYNEEESYEGHVEKWHHESAGQYECAVCHYRFAKEGPLRKHVYWHGRRWRCLRCGYVLTRTQLTSHHSRCAQTEPVACQICGNTLQTEFRLKIHMRNLHRGKGKHYICDTCGKSFEFKYHIRDHIRCHTGVKPYECDICGKSSTKIKLHIAHLKTHEERERREDVYCVECDRYFKTPILLQNHLTRSLNHVTKDVFKHACDECTDRFPAAGQLRQHVNTVHRNHRPHACHLCDKVLRILHKRRTKQTQSEEARAAREVPRSRLQHLLQIIFEQENPGEPHCSYPQEGASLRV